MNYSKELRGIRNNNPLNIRRNPRNKWQGLRPVQDDPSFCQFTEMKWGLRAAIKLMENYIKKGCKTPRQIISRWAPPSENDTASYVRKACQRAGLDPDFPVLFWADLRKLIKAMAWIESRFQPSDELLDEARKTLGQWKMDNGQWTMGNGQWKMNNGKWTMDNGECKM